MSDAWRNSILLGDVRQTLRTLPEGCVHGVITSPPYFALRAYLSADHPDKALEIGSESSLAEFVQTQVDVFREVKRVLRDDGILYVNYGDTMGGGGGYSPNAPSNNPAAQRERGTSQNRGSIDGRGAKTEFDGQPLNVPFRVAEALRADGWWLRQTIVWQKKSPMPESLSGWKWAKCRVKVNGTRWDGDSASNADESPADKNFDAFRPHLQPAWPPCPGCPKCLPHGGYVLRRGRGRFTSSFEYVFLFSKTRDYFFDLEAAKEKAVGGTPGNKTHRGAEAYANGDAHMRTKVGLTNMVAAETRIPRNVWTIPGEGMYRLRADLTDEQRAYVLSRLASGREQ